MRLLYSIKKPRQISAATLKRKLTAKEMDLERAAKLRDLLEKLKK